MVRALLHVFGLWPVRKEVVKENIERRGVTRCFPEGRKNLVFHFGFLIGKHTSATLARKLFVVPVLVYLYAVEGKKVRHFNEYPIKFCSRPLHGRPIRGRPLASSGIAVSSVSLVSDALWRDALGRGPSYGRKTTNCPAKYVRICRDRPRRSLSAALSI